jgi:pimeloyl-ACP methyl ester carboxylesterase
MIRHDFFEKDGIRLHYAAEGSGKLMLFAHGFPEFWYSWKNQLEEFGKTHLAVAPDLRGYNLSSKPARVEDYAISALAGDLVGLAQHLGYPKFTLVGHDWGGALAWALAIAYPELIEKLVIINAPHPATFARELKNSWAQRRASWYMLLFQMPFAENLLRLNGYSALVRSTLRDGLKKNYFNEQDRQAYLEAWSQPGAFTSGLNYYRALPLKNLFSRKRLEIPGLGADSLLVRVPTLVLWGEKDQYLLPGNLDGLEEFVPDLTVRRFPDASH